MESVVAGVSCLTSVVSLVCWIMVLIKMFSAEGIGKGIFGIICSLYALIWGWQNAETENIKPVMIVWTLMILFNIIGSVAAGALGAAAQ